MHGIFQVGFKLSTWISKYKSALISINKSSYNRRARYRGSPRECREESSGGKRMACSSSIRASEAGYTMNQ